MTRDGEVNQIHALCEALGVEGEGVCTFGDKAQVAVHHEAAVDVVNGVERCRQRQR